MTELSNLKQRLWACAEVLRGSAVDRTDWKAYILPLVFFKRICDVWDEETAEATETYGDADSSEFPEIHRFAVPDGCHWSDVRATPSNVGEALARSMREIERSNPDRLFRVFGAADWGNKEILGDELLKNLIEELSSVPLGNTAVASDILGDAYEFLVGQFADVTRRKKAGEFYTPRSVIKLMTQILDPQEGETIYDPACGTGGMLLGAIEHVESNGGDPRTFYGKIFGQEKNLNTSSIARMNLVLHGVEDFEIVREDTLRSPAFSDPATGGLGTFDCVIANPPFSLKEWGREEWESDPWGRNTTGIPPASSGDFAWIQHMIASMAAPNGRLALVLPQGVLIRRGQEGRIRREIFQGDLIETVICLAENLFYGTTLAASVLVLRADKPAERRNKVLVIDASEIFRRGKAQNFLDPEHIDQILTLERDFTSVKRKAAVLDVADIEATDWTLNVSQVLADPFGQDVPALGEALVELRQALEEVKAAEDNLRAVLGKTGLIQ